MEIKFQTQLGEYYVGDSTSLSITDIGKSLEGKVQLIFTSPPFPLNSKKSYRNREGKEYLNWFTELAPLLAKLLKDDGSIVVELGNAWESGRPIQSLLHLEALIGFVNNPDAGLRLCQQFICYNPSRLPSPAQWVTLNHIRTTDSFTHVWWMAKSDYPKADTDNVHRPYSKSMQDLLKRQKYNAGKRPSEHTISPKGFLTNRGGSIPHNLFEMEAMDKNRDPRLPNAFSFSNTQSNSFFLQTCRERNVQPHPARMPEGLASFFIQFLTDPGDLVLDPFAGSNTTGYVAECLGRKWLSIDARDEYVEQVKIRFEDPLIAEFSRRS
jgi:site-specific DNA-methyltransferase (cytosine-N4-specific)